MTHPMLRKFDHPTVTLYAYFVLVVAGPNVVLFGIGNPRITPKTLCHRSSKMEPEATAAVGEDGFELSQRTLTLTSLAILKVDIGEHHRNYLDYLGPFVLDIIAGAGLQVVTDEIIAGFLEKQLGLKVPIKAVQHVLRYLARQSYLKKENEIYRPIADLPVIDLSVKRQDAVVRIQRVYSALCGFAPTIHPDLIWSDSHAANAIVGFLGRFAVDCLKTYVFNTALPHVPESGPQDVYIVSRFLRHAYENDRGLFEDFIVLVKGQMYANALTCPDLQSLSQKFNRVAFYLDTPLILNLLGLQGEGQRQAAAELMTLVRDLHGTLAVFDHTFAEILGVIRYAADHIDDPKTTNRVLREIRASKVNLADLIVLMEQLETRLADHHIAIHLTPPYVHELNIDHEAFQAALGEEIAYHGDHALKNDINSIRSIYVLRRGRLYVRLEDCVAVLVTNNVLFARVAFEFGKSHNSSREVSTVITDYSLANVAWLKAPMKWPSLPEKETLALCYAALEPNSHLFRKYVEMMDNLRQKNEITPEIHAILRSSPIAYRELMDFTLGEEKALTGYGMGEIIDRVKNSLIDEHLRSSTEERQKADKEHENETQKYLLNQELLRKELQVSNERNRAEQEAKARVLTTAEKRIRFLSKGFTLTMMILFSGALLLGVALGSGLLSAPSSYKVTGVILISFAVIWGWYNWITGRTIRAITEQIERGLVTKVFSWLTGV
jgi:hypothetical protein